ncbi:MAG: tetratricopeptide repeat protein, partial [Kofleriaceae bacterium]|nr:tetratricopeptide repeat protein [Kofleriaceae bacterium]
KSGGAVGGSTRRTVELPVPASTVNIPGGTTRKRSSGPVVAGLLALAGILFASMAYMKCRKPSAGTKPLAQSGSQVSSGLPAVDAGVDAPLPLDASPIAVEVIDASLASSPSDAAPSKKYRELLVKAKTALDEGDAASALRLAVESIQDKATGKGYVTKADALRRLARTEEALIAITSALRMANDFAPAWEMKGRILWGAKRTGEATAAFERFLQLEPNGERADGIRALLGK